MGGKHAVIEISHLSNKYNLILFIHQYQPYKHPFPPNSWRELAGRSTNVFPLAQFVGRNAKIILVTAPKIIFPGK